MEVYTVYRSSIQNWGIIQYIRVQNEIDKLVEEVQSMMTEQTMHLIYLDLE